MRLVVPFFFLSIIVDPKLYFFMYLDSDSSSESESEDEVTILKNAKVCSKLCFLDHEYSVPRTNFPSSLSALFFFCTV